MLYVGIDPGTHTGLALWNGKMFLALETLPIHRAMDMVLSWWEHMEDQSQFMVVCEDARQRGCSRYEAAARAQGAGSVKRDCSIWEDFCRDKGIQIWMLPPAKHGTKCTAAYFKAITGYKGRTSNHARDAAMLVYGR